MQLVKFEVGINVELLRVYVHQFALHVHETRLERARSHRIEKVLGRDGRRAAEALVLLQSAVERSRRQAFPQVLVHRPTRTGVGLARVGAQQFEVGVLRVHAKVLRARVVFKAGVGHGGSTHELNGLFVLHRQLLRSNYVGRVRDARLRPLREVLVYEFAHELRVGVLAVKHQFPYADGQDLGVRSVVYLLVGHHKHWQRALVVGGIHKEVTVHQRHRFLFFAAARTAVAAAARVHVVANVARVFLVHAAHPSLAGGRPQQTKQRRNVGGASGVFERGLPVREARGVAREALGRYVDAHCALWVDRETVLLLCTHVIIKPPRVVLHALGEDWHSCVKVPALRIGPSHAESIVVDIWVHRLLLLIHVRNVAIGRDVR